MKFAENPAIGNRNFLKLKPGEHVAAVIRGDEHVFYSMWKGDKSFVCDKDAEGAKFRFRVNVIVFENGAFVPKIWEQGAQVYHALKEINDEYGLETSVLKIKREGSGPNTTYSILPMKKELTKDQIEKLSQVKLHNLESKNSGASADAPEVNYDEEIPF